MRRLRNFNRALLFAVLCIPAVAAEVSVVQDADSPLKIISKPQARARGCSGGSGRTVIKVSFDKSGQVTDATTISASPCASFNQEAVRAARKIKFKPAMKNGAPVTTVKSVEYSYSIY